MLKLLDLFSGIGGFSLGLERSGYFKTVAFCECDEFARKVLGKHWPGVKQYEDVCTLTGESLERDSIKVEAICGGFPCQDISNAGMRAGLEGARSGLWRQYARLIQELRPQVAFIENVAALRRRGLAVVLRDLARMRYDAEWYSIPASALGAPHKRERVWIIAYPQCLRLENGLHGAISEGIRKHQETFHRSSVKIGSHTISCGDNYRETFNLSLLGDGVSPQLAKRHIKALGNSMIPEIPERLGRAYGETL